MSKINLLKNQKNKIDKIIIFCNTVATKDSAKLGYYPGTRDEKLLDSQIGNLLSSKFGGRCEVERMIQEEKLVLLPMSDVRGYDTSGMRAGVYISEAQNMSVNLMKLALQRIGEDSICIIDGDCKTQVDDINFAGSNNGMRRASQVFRGHDVYGEIIADGHHSHLAALSIFYKLKQDKAIMITDSLRPKGCPKDGYYTLGSHVIEIDDEGLAKIKGTNTIAGSTLRMNKGLKLLVEQVKIPFDVALNSCTINPARCLNVDHYKGLIKALIWRKYDISDTVAIMMNYICDPNNKDYVKDFNDFQSYRKEVKEFAKNHFERI